MKQWTNGYGEVMTAPEVGDHVFVTTKYGTFASVITAVLPRMTGYYRCEGYTEAIWREQITYR